MFYYQYLVNNVALISDQSILQKINVTIDSSTYAITTTNYYNFQQTFSNTSQTLAALQGTGLWCNIDSYLGGPTYSTVLSSGSNSWLTYILTGLASVGTLSLT